MKKSGDIRNRALGTRTGTVVAALAEMVRLRKFDLSADDIQSLDQQNDQIISGWVFAYRLVQLPKADWDSILRNAILDTNPRIREQVCDIIGDEHIERLRDDLKLMFDDPVSFVAEAAKYNYSEMFDA